MRIWRKNNPEKVKEAGKRDGKKWREHHKNEYYQMNRERLLEQQRDRRNDGTRYKTWFELNRERLKDYQRQNYMKVSGKTIRVSKRPQPLNRACEICGNTTRRLSYHHWDDSHPCMGIWLCTPCHIMAEGVDEGYHITYLHEKYGMVLVKPS